MNGWLRTPCGRILSNGVVKLCCPKTMPAKPPATTIIQKMVRTRRIFVSVAVERGRL